MEGYRLPVLDELEAEAIHVLREAAAEFKRPALLSSADPGFACLVRLAQKAFAPGSVPFPTVQTEGNHDALIAAHAGHGNVHPLVRWTERDVRTYLAGESGPAVELLRFVIAGGAEDGKSTLAAQLTRAFDGARRRFAMTHLAGHEDDARVIVTAASAAELGLLVIDAGRGVQAQTRRHAFMCSLLGIPRLVVAVNKMDLAGYAQQRFDELRAVFEAFAARLAFKNIAFIPLSASLGENVARESAAMPWYAGEPLLAHLENVYIGGDRNLVDLRLPVQSVQLVDGKRWYLGRVESGVVKPGDEVVLLPSHRRSRVGAVRLDRKSLEYAYAPLSVALALEDDIDASQGAIVAHPRNVPHAVRALDAMVVWMAAQPLAAGKVYQLRLGTRRVRASCAEVNYRMDADSLHRGAGHELNANDIGRAAFTLFEERFVDSFAKNRSTGSFDIVDTETGLAVGVGMIVDRETEQARVKPGEAAKRIVIPHASKVSTVERAELLGQRSVTVWLTGLSGSGKSTLATELERRLVEAGRACYMLDGDNVRAGINRDLGFGPDDRRENIRRIAEVSKLMNDAGLITVTAFISPYRADRDMARTIIGAERFVEIFVDAPLAVCEGRDPKGLYKKARKGEIPEFTGISAPYEAPEAPSLAVHTGSSSIGECVAQLMALVSVRTRH